MSGRLAGRRAVVTGAAAGIGRALALGVAAEGAAVACLDLDAPGAADVTAAITAQGGTAVALVGDASDWADVERTRDQALEALGGVDLLVANAGGSLGEVVAFLELEPADWHTTVRRNLDSAFLCGLAYARVLAAGGGGAMVFLASQQTEAVRPGMAPYAATKAAVRQLVRGMAVDLAPHGIRVNAIAPGPTMTPGLRPFFERPATAAFHRGRIPLGRVAEPEELVGACVYLASDEASYTTGTTIFVDGGYTVT